MTPDALTPHFFTEFDKEARSRESRDPFYHDAVRLVEEYRAALNTITQQAQELERVKERLHRYNHWTPEHTIEEWLADRQRIVDAKQVEADAQLQATLAAREAEIDRLKLAQQHSIQDECEAEQRLIDAGISDYEDGGQGEYRGLLTQIDLCIKERDAALAEQAVLDAKYVDERAAKDSAMAEVEQYYKCLQIEKGEHARALDERDALTLTWTTARPTVAGSYWYRYDEADPNPVIVKYLTEELNRIDYLAGEWAGPIPLPMEAQQARGSSGGAANHGAGT